MFDVSAEGVHQEEQGERYQFGPKAQRHYSNSTLCYKIASSLSPTSFDAHYNLSRVNLHLATDHLPAPQCLTTVAEAVAGFGKAVDLAAAEGEGEAVTKTIDGGFNLAQALMAGRGLIEEGAGGVEGDGLRMAEEARGWLERVEGLQRQEMANAGFTAANEASDPAEEESTLR